MSFTVTYNNITDQVVGCHAKTRPSVPAPVRRVAVSTIPGRDGSYYDTDNAFEDIVIPITFMFNDPNRNRWHTVYRNIKAWLLSGANGNLSFSDDSGMHYRVHNVVIVSTERTAFTIGEVDVRFCCDGYTYLDSGDTDISMPAQLNNEHSTAKPIYTIVGTGQCTLTVNGKTMTATVNQNLTIDTERMLAIQNGSTWVNTTVSGDYEDLWLKPGMNLLTITSGFTCTLKPQWRCV